MHYTSHIEISQSALKKNLHFLQDYLNKGVRISSVIKGDAYGHGISHFVPIAQSCGIDHFSVFSSNEARQALACSRPGTTILIMGMIYTEELAWAIENDIEYFVFDTDRLYESIRVAKELGKKAKIHLELETGLNRTGFTKPEINANLDAFRSEHLEVIGICTHFAGAESIANFYRIHQQRKRFQHMSQWLKSKGVEYRIRHTACSAAAIKFPETQMDMVRIGIMQYGFWPSMEIYIHYMTKKKFKEESPISRVLSWKSTVMSLKTVPAGQFVSYGTTYLTPTDKRIAGVPVGYAHGYDRGLSNQGRVIINGHRLPVIGLVNMNMLLVDVTGADEVKKGDEVVLIGRQGDMEISVASFSELSNQLNYEMLTRLPNDIPRRMTD